MPLGTKTGAHLYARYLAGAQKYLSVLNTTLNLVAFPIFCVCRKSSLEIFATKWKKIFMLKQTEN